MIFISHRGNLAGPSPSRENTIAHINTALYKGFDVEADVWYVNSKLYFGHDTRQEPVPISMITNPHMWFHCKNVEALRYLGWFSNNIKFFWHQHDDYTLVSDGNIWVYPGKKLVYNSIACLPEQAVNGNWMDCYAICTDYVYRYKEEYESHNINKGSV
jgi:hypothetical protein